MSAIVQRERHGAVTLVRLNRPAALNALSDDLLAALCASLDAVEEAGEARCIVLSGAGRAFAAGADVAGLRALTPDEVLSGERGRRWQRLRAARLPVIAAVQGWCLGGGCELALTCDIVIAASDARFGLPETGLGLIPGAGGTQRMPRAVGRSLALEIILAGRTLSAQEALRAGICSRVVAPEALEREALALAARIAARPAAAVRLAREAVQLAFEVPLAEGLSEERRLFAEAFASADAREGMDAFVERRAPVWSHAG
jgi:enoyl-CoA hydratase